jgi:hypothetical protein
MNSTDFAKTKIHSITEFIGRRKVTLALALMTGFILGLVGERLLSSRNVSSSLDINNGIGIPAFVQQVREELIASDIQRGRTNMPALFTAKSVDLEIAFVAKKSDSASGKLTLEVVDVDAKRELSSEKTQKMTLHLDIAQPEQLSIPPSPGKNETRK